LLGDEHGQLAVLSFGDFPCLPLLKCLYFTVFWVLGQFPSLGDCWLFHRFWVIPTAHKNPWSPMLNVSLGLELLLHFPASFIVSSSSSPNCCLFLPYYHTIPWPLHYY
jgi:hypothetical protein